MQPIGYYMGVPVQLEVLIWVVSGICFAIFDSSLLKLNSNLTEIWSVVLDQNYFGDLTQLAIRYLLSGIVVVRTFSVHLYCMFYILILWPAIFLEKPFLLLPWLTIGAITSIGMPILSTITGYFICAVVGFHRPACYEFSLAQIISHGPPMYVWFVVLKFYVSLTDTETSSVTKVGELKRANEEYESDLTLRRRRARSMSDKDGLDMDDEDDDDDDDDDYKNISDATMDDLLREISAQLNCRTSRSLDTMLVLLSTEVEKREVLKFYDDDDDLSLSQKTMNLLNLTAMEIEQAQKRKREREVDEWIKNTIAEFCGSNKVAEYHLPPSRKSTDITCEMPQQDSEMELTIVERSTASKLSLDEEAKVSVATSISRTQNKPLLKETPLKEIKHISVQTATNPQVPKTSSPRLTRSKKVDKTTQAVISRNRMSENQPVRTVKVTNVTREPTENNTTHTSRGYFRDDGYLAYYRSQAQARR